MFLRAAELAVSNPVGRLHLGPQTALQAMMLTLLLILAWKWLRWRARRRVRWAARVVHRLHPYTETLYDQVRSAPMTAVYVAAWSVTSVIQQGTPQSIQDVVDRFNSTNLELLSRNPVRVLFSSAFIVADRALAYGAYVLLYLVVVASLERLLGWRRTLLVWLAAHVLGSLATALTEALLIEADILSKSYNFASDVGVSYVLVGSCGAFVVVARRRTRWVVLTGLVLIIGIPLATTHTIWDVGHVYAALLGAGAGWLVVRNRPVEPLPALRERLQAARSREPEWEAV